ncbi:MAG: hypothetical protein NZ922_05360 [Candidatus Methanomethyliaceae archaeon]|nr:hypothetical protein [Candidatus Methanomethyliaceae archaeon]MDW7970601.1 hypothetical protein [Nitrososphaerota archaeon]
MEEEIKKIKIGKYGPPLELRTLNDPDPISINKDIKRCKFEKSQTY